MTKIRATPEDIDAFAEAIYPGFGQLMLSSFSEKKFLSDATEELKTLRTRLAAAEKVVEAAREGIPFYGGWPGYDKVSEKVENALAAYDAAKGVR